MDSIGQTRWSRRTIAIVLLISQLSVTGLSSAQAPTPAPAEPMPTPDLSASVLRMLEAAYLTEEEGKDARIGHGVWRAGDLDTPERAARAALIRGAWNDPSLDDGGIDVLDRAEARLRRGDAEAALDLLGEDGHGTGDTRLGVARLSRLRAEALEILGRFDDAVTAGEAGIGVLSGLFAGAGEGGGSGDDRARAVEGVHAVWLVNQRLRLRGPLGGSGGQVAGDYQAMIEVLGRIRTRLDRQCWLALTLEARILLERDNRAEAHKAALEALSLNPSSVEAWTILGRMTVDSFDFGATERVALRLDLLAGGDPEERENESAGADGVSVEGALLRARAMLRQADGAEALTALGPVLREYPLHPEVRALEAAARAVAFEFDQVEALLSSFDAARPGSPLGWFEVGRALSEARQYDAAAKHLAEAHRRQPMAPEPLIERGLLELQAGRDAEALAALERAFELDPFNARADNSLRLVRELATYARYETAHFVVRCRPGPAEGGEPAALGDNVLAREMGPLLEEIHRVVTGSQPGGIDHVPARKTLIDLMPDHRWFGVRIAGMPRIHTIAASTGPVIAMEAPRDGPDHLGTYDWVRVVRHEYVHTVTLSRTNNRIPHWFTEAAAVYLELAPLDESTARLLADTLAAGRLFDFQEINLAFVRPRRPTDRAQAYAQGHWMYGYMIDRWGASAPLRLMDLYAEGVREEEAFGRVLGVTRAEFLREFTLWAAGQVVEWGLGLKPGVPSVKSLLIEHELSDPARARAFVPNLGRAAEDLARWAAGTGVDEPAEAGALAAGWRVEPPTPTDEMITAWLAAHPAHPDVLELATTRALAAGGGRATPETADLFRRYAAAREVAPAPHRALARMLLDELTRSPERAAELSAAVIPHLEYLDAREQKTPAYALELARRYAALGDWAQALVKGERATQVAPYDARPRELAATLAIQAKNLAAAERHIWALTQLEPDRPLHAERLRAIRAMRQTGAP